MIQALIDGILASNQLHRRILETEYRLLSNDEVIELEAYLEYCTSRGLSIQYLAASYNMVVNDMVKEQIYYRRFGKYRHSSYLEVSQLVYMNNEYMQRYMYGLAISAFLWRNHRLIRKWFFERIPKDIKGNYLEIGPGHGYYFIEAMNRTSYETFIGIDISRKSSEMTRDIIESGHFGRHSNYTIINKDFLSYDCPAPFDAVVMSEVIEHVEAPGAFLKKACEISSEKPYIYVSTCINSPAIDHITLFKSMDDIRSLVESCDLRIAQEFIVPYNGTTLEESIYSSLPINVALQLSKQ